MRLLLLFPIPPFTVLGAFFAYSFFGAAGFYTVLFGVLASLIFYLVYDEGKRGKIIANSKPIPKERREMAVERFVREVQKKDQDRSE